MIPPVERLVRISVSSESAAYGAWVDRCVVNGSGMVALLSVCGPSAIVKGIGALLSRGGPAARLTISSDTPFLNHGKIVTTWDYELNKHVQGPEERTFDVLARHPEGYIRYLCKMDYGHAQAIFVAKQPGLLLNTSDQSIAAVLRDPAVCTTPFLPEWVPYIAEQLRIHKVLNDLYGFQCRAAIIRPGCTKEVDAIVLKGGQDGHIKIPA